MRLGSSPFAAMREHNFQLLRHASECVAATVWDRLEVAMFAPNMHCHPCVLSTMSHAQTVDWTLGQSFPLFSGPCQTIGCHPFFVIVICLSQR
eukprot:5963495-Amphidinium_carterae.1